MKKRFNDADYMREIWYPNHKKEHMSYVKRHQIRLQEFIDYLKLGKHCADCGRIFPPEAMDFDHVRGIKTRSISSMPYGTGSAKSILEEIKKCDLICACCHRIRTAKRNRGSSVRYAHPIARRIRIRVRKDAPKEYINFVNSQNLRD